MAKYVGAIDQGTTSTRFMIFDHAGQVIGIDQKEHEQIFPKPGWVEHDPMEVWAAVQAVIAGALAKAHVDAKDLAAVGLLAPVLMPLVGGLVGVFTYDAFVTPNLPEKN